jgi:hypothetical protein
MLLGLCDKAGLCARQQLTSRIEEYQKEQAVPRHSSRGRHPPETSSMADELFEDFMRQ